MRHIKFFEDFTINEHHLGLHQVSDVEKGILMKRCGINMKWIKLFGSFSLEIGCSKEKKEPDYAKAGAETGWELKDGTKVTLKDIVEFLDEQNVPIIEIETDSVKHLLIDVERDPNRVDAANLDFPIIVSEYKGEFKNILDGQHRLVKTIKYGINKIKARILDLDNCPDVFKKLFL